MAWAFEALRRWASGAWLLLAAVASLGCRHGARAQEAGVQELADFENASALARQLQAPLQVLPPDAALQLGYTVGPPYLSALGGHPAYSRVIPGPIGAGVTYAGVEIWTLASTFQYAVDARLRVVDSTMDSPQAALGDCLTDYKDSRYVQGAWGTLGADSTPFESDEKLKADEALVFRQGGSYRLCYSANGTFFAGSADVTPVSIRVNGVSQPTCATTNCLSHRPFRCYVRRGEFNTINDRYGLVTSCAVDIPAVEGTGKGAWSEEFGNSGYDTLSGANLGFSPRACGTEPSSFICSDGGACDAGIASMPLETSGGTTRINIPTTRGNLQGSLGASAFRARTVAACYCPNFGGCDSHTEFLQQIGVMHFFASKVCHPLDTSCTNDFTGVTSQYRFRVRVECPTDACPADGESRVKIIVRDASNDFPSWDSQNGCRTGEHGHIGGIMRLPPTPYQPIDGSAAGTINPQNCFGPLDCHLSGGMRQDYKEFGGSFGFRFVMGTTNHEHLHFYNSQDLDVCFCTEACDVESNWFKSGAMRLSPTRLVSSATARSNLPAQWMIQYVNQPGIIGISRPYADSGALGLQETGVLKIVTDPMQEINDEGCAWGSYNSQLTEGLSTEVDASLNFLGMTNPPETQKIVFNSRSLVNTITLTEPGAIAVCYCAITLDTRCAEQSNWKLLTHVTIKGPKTVPAQRWQFSTNVVFRFSYEGYGLSNGDELRIISSDGSCTSNNFNPNTAAYVYTALQVRCPVPCTQVGLIDSAEPGNLPTQVLSADTWGCDRRNENCREPGNDITHVTVINDYETELVFQVPHMMVTGDEMTLGDNILCDPTDTVCTPEMLSALKGVYDFADREANSAASPNTWMTAHRLTETDNARRVRIRIGWPAERRPRFIVQFAGARPFEGYIGRGGKWTHHSRAQTREEIMATEERANLRVCWKFGGNGAKYVEEVGRLTIRNPAAMEGATVSITTTAEGAKAPMILQFRTATGVTGLRYDQAEDSLRLKILFTHTDLLDMFYSNLEADVIPDDVFYEVENGKQSVCGRLFLELWSNDIENGFPHPKACYFKSFPGANQRELYMIFDGKNGLRKDTLYQIVFNGAIQNVLDNENNLIQTNFMELFPMDDVTSRPYEAIERGVVNLVGQSPQRLSTDEADPRFSETTGFKIVGGYNDLLEIRTGDKIVAEFMGGASAAKIVPGCVIRVFLWPLTMWKTTASCTARCLVGSEVSFQCATIQCRGTPTIPDGSLNILKMQLPSAPGAWENLYGDKKVRIEIGAITIPSGGFFAQRLAAQVTTPIITQPLSGDDKPHYVHSVGNFIWKEPNEGQTVAMVLSPLGGGNSKPFKGDTANVLYARLTLASTIRTAERFTTDATFTITLPSGYTCLQMNPTVEGENAWAAEASLPAWRNYVPQGRGTPSDGTNMYGWSVNANTCTYKPEHPHGVIYAGSSLVVKITVNNPAEPLQQGDLTNMWTFRMQAKGMYTQHQTTMEYPFLATADDMYDSNNGVLGRVTDAYCSPTNFNAMTLRDVIQDVRVFFRTEQLVSAGGQVRLTAPAAFSFGNPCEASDLGAQYYATTDALGAATLPLPGIISCTGLGPNNNIAHIGLHLLLEGGRKFGFKIRVQNPSEFDGSESAGWTIFTADSLGYRADGKLSVPMQGRDDDWLLFPETPPGFTASVQVSDMRPFVLSGSRSYISMVLMSVPSGPSGLMRFTAPEGYVFRFTDSQFVYQRLADPNIPVSHRLLVPPGVNANFPGVPPFPPSGTAELLFASGTFDSSLVYGFAVPVEIPVQTPTTSSNSFFLEIGYDAANLDDRTGAVHLDAPPVRALKNAKVDYTTTIVGKENALQMTIETITAIPEGGGLRVVSPEGFRYQPNCELIAQISPDASPPPAISCESIFDRNEGTLGRPVLLLRAQAGGVPPGIHKFAVLAENPIAQVNDWMSTTTSCGRAICWSFQSFRYLESPTQASSEPLDYRTATPGFPIRRKMLEARIPPLSEAQQRSTGRDDRPLQPNNVIFAFKLSTDATASGEMLLRGPYGVQFAQECSQEIEVSWATVFGAGNRFPPEFDVWPSDEVTISSCRGEGTDAKLQVTMAPGAMLQANKLYLFRIRIMVNPLETPAVNRWNIMFAGEASEPMEGFTLWAFTRTTITPMSTARARTLAGEARTRNPLYIRMRPFNTVPSGGEIRAYAPVGFQFAARPSLECDVQLSELPYSNLGIQYPGYTWPSEGLVCLVEVGEPRTVSIRLRDPRPVSADLDYTLILYVYNPATPFEGRFSNPTVWVLSSFKPGALSLDESRITAFRINSVMNLWFYENPNPAEVGQEMRNGGERLPAFKIKMAFPDELKNGDTIIIRAPPDFSLIDTSGRCRRFAWVSTDPDTEEGWSPLPNSRWPLCNESSMTIYIEEPFPIARDTQIQFSLEIYNPLRTPFMGENVWRCWHYGPAPDDGVLGSDNILSSNAFTGWDIIPQLEEVSIDLIGPFMAAESMSTIRVVFTAVTDAQDIAIVIHSPDDFDFGMTLIDDPAQQILRADTVGNRMRIRTDIRSGTRYTFLLRNVKLGTGGGQTDISLTTWVGGMLINGEWQPGTKRDEKMHFLDGFRLPGRIIVRYDRLENNYHQNPGTYPVQASWSSQMGRPAYATFRFLLTRPAEIGHYLKIKAPPYELMRRLFVLQEAPASILTSTLVQQRPVANDIAAVISGELHTRLNERMVPNQLYEVIVSVIAPNPVAVDNHGGPLKWILETTDNGPMPTNTNDGVSREFPIVEEYGFEVIPVMRAPPTAEVEVRLIITRGLRDRNAPTEMAVVAPLGFNFSDGCLVYGGDDVLACERGTPTPDGRAVAKLSCNEAGISSTPGDIRIKVMTPPQPPVAPAWFIEGQDWLSGEQWGWGEAVGVQVEQMADTAVAYPGIGGVKANMVWRFRCQVMVQAGGWLHVKLPEGMSPQCGGSDFMPIALPDSGGCHVQDEMNLVIYLNSTIVPGEYAFAFKVTPPQGTPLRNQLSLILKDNEGNVRDAAVNMMGKPIYEKLKIGERPLQWTSSKPLRSSVITIGFEAIEPLPDIIVAPLQQISEILITLPVGFQHLVSTMQDFTLVNEDMPLLGSMPDGMWLDFMQKDRLRVIMNLNRTSWTTLKVGNYEFRFPVLVPSPLPVFNAWHLSLCSPNFPEGCSRLTDPAVMLTLAYPGFALGQPSTGGVLTAAAVHRCGSATAAMLLPLLLLLTSGTLR